MSYTKPTNPKQFRSVLRNKKWRILFFTVCSCVTHPVIAEINFEEVTQAAGIIHTGQTYGASWGDLNNDGWPDLWVGNHNSKPSFYLNNQGGGFRDAIDEVWKGDPNADTHGAAWADFDNDGDQDLVELVGALENPDGTFCIGCGQNHFYINENGSLVEKAKDLGINVDGFARSPLWIDADKDGLLDLVIVNTRKPRKPTSTIFHQTENGFLIRNDAFGFRDDRWSRRDQIRGWFQNLLKLRFHAPSRIDMRTHLEFAQLASLSTENALDLVLFSSPTRVYAIDDTPFSEVTAEAGLPSYENVTNAVIEDFDGNGESDLYLTLGPYLTSDVVQTSADKIKGTLTGAKGGKPRTVVFHTEGKLDVELHPTWLSTTKVFIGSEGRHPKSRTIAVSPNDPGTHGPAPTKTDMHGGVSIIFNPGEKTWTIRNSLKGEFVDFIVTSTSPISRIKTYGFQPFKETGVDALFLRRGNEFVRQELLGNAGAPTSCHFATAADFDNDMDIDLYLVCSGPVENIPNRLLENDGKGNFRLVPTAGGAAGSSMGRGDVAAVADYDRDGFLDLFVTNGWDPSSPFVKDGPHQLFRNRGNSHHWLEIDLEGVESNRDGIGARVIVKAGGVTQTRVQRGGMNRITQNHQRLHFGLGNNAKISQITIRWPSGRTQVLQDVAADRILHIRENL